MFVLMRKYAAIYAKMPGFTQHLKHRILCFLPLYVLKYRSVFNDRRDFKIAHSFKYKNKI